MHIFYFIFTKIVDNPLDRRQTHSAEDFEADIAHIEDQTDSDASDHLPDDAVGRRFVGRQRISKNRNNHSSNFIDDECEDDGDKGGEDEEQR